MEEYSHNLEKNLEDLEMEVEALNAMINELLRRVSKEKDRGLQTLPEVKEWISMAEKIAPKASRLLDKSISKCHDLSRCARYDDCSKISESTLRYSDKVCKRLKKVKALRSEGVFKELVERAPLSHVKNMLPLQPIGSREMLLEKVWKCLAGNECRTLGLYGMAGVGKTTLLTQIKKKFIQVRNVSSGFVVLFVVVESEKVQGIQVAIMKRLGLHWSQRSEREKASEIYEFLNRKRFVLLLDGVQREGVDLECIGVPEPTRENGCKIVFTTRFQETCRSKWVDAVEEVKCLSPEEAWDIFQEIVGETTLKIHPDIPQLARIVARKCGGLPIALGLIGKTMSSKRTVREWHHAIHVLVSSAAEFSGMEAELLPILKFTYDNLPGENVRSCFLYCALFLKNCDISKQDLVDCWIAEGMIEEEEDREMAEIQGYEMMGDLVRMRLLMHNESGYGVSMHGMVREMALWIASDFGRQKENFVVVGDVGIDQMAEVNDWRIVRRMSVTCTHVEKISDSPDCPELTTLFLQENNLKWVAGDFFRWMTSLVVLNLSRNRELSELPEEVSRLVSLRLLNLSFTSIKSLPLGLKELKKLIHLDLDDTPLLRGIGVISNLLNLQVLRLFRSVPMYLSLIQLLKSLKELSLTVREGCVLKQLLNNHRLASCIRRLHLTGITIADGGILLLSSMLSLGELDIEMCNIQEITINWREALQFGNNEKIPRLQNIRTVTLSRCTGPRDLTWLLLATNLGDLRIHECQQIERIINKEKAMADMSEQPFQNLTRLSLDGLPQLESIYWMPLQFPVLEYLYITGCPKLKTDFDHEWEDEATKQHLSDIDDRDFLKMAEEQKMDGLESESHPIEKTFQSGTEATMEHTQTYRVLKPDAMISVKKYTPGKISKDPQVFINFRGDELRKNFVDNLVIALKAAKINFFIDDHEQVGRNLEHLFTRIEESRVALAIFSKEYTTSEWCLDELVKIKECMEKGTLTGIPIFYKVDPSVVRNREGSFGDKLRKLKRENLHDPVRTQKWEEALSYITEIIGLHLREESDLSDSNFVESIVMKLKGVLANIPKEGNTDSFMFRYAKNMQITHSKNPKHWTWSSIRDGPNQVAIDIATLKEVSWLYISGNYDTKKLTPETKYEVVFVVKLEYDAIGWQEPVKLSLKLVMSDKTEIKKTHEFYLDTYIGDDEWVDVKAGDFVLPPENVPVKITFTMSQKNDAIRKTGLVVKGVAIRAVD